MKQFILFFGDNAFFTPDYNNKVSKPGKTVYDPLMQSVAKHIENKNKLIENKEEIEKNKFAEAIKTEEGKKVFDGRDNLPSTVKNRIEYFDRLFAPYIK